MRRAPVALSLLAVLAFAGVACSSAPPAPARDRFVQRLRQPGPHRFDQVQVGDGATALTAAQASCVADAFERLRWPLESALDNKVPTKVDVKLVTQAANACIDDPTTTTIGPFG